MLAVGPVAALAREVAAAGGAARPPRVFVGDAVKAHPLRRATWAKAADLHLLEECGGGAQASVVVRGVVEVKSYAATAERLRLLVEQHVARARGGLLIREREFGPRSVAVGRGNDGPARIMVVPDSWLLPRRFRFLEKDGRNVLDVPSPVPPAHGDRAARLAPSVWLVTLRWSEEALADIAYGMTFWYMGVLGRLLYERDGVPREWSEMSPEEAGQNAVKLMLYYAILRARTVREESRATALYNSYGFGYALGSSFVNRKGRREVLFFEDLEEILATGRSRTKPIDDGHPAQHCRIRGFERGSMQDQCSDQQ
jgi:hypothetical protein